MRIFVTGATGFIGSAIVRELIDAGHEAVGLARTDAGAAALAAAGATPHRGDLENLGALRAGAAMSDGVVHAGFIHDWANFMHSCAVDKTAIETLGAALGDSGRPLVVASGVALVCPGQFATEDMAPPSPSPFPRVSEQVAAAIPGVRACAARFAPTVHGEGDHGFVARLVAIAREKGVSAYIGDGLNRWPAVHRRDAARLVRLALENEAAGARIHAIAEEGVVARDIATAIGRGLGVPVVSKSAEEATEHFGFLGRFFALDCPASNALTRQRLGWNPMEPGLLADLDGPSYFRT